MENKFYKLVDGILWADWVKPEFDYGFPPDGPSNSMLDSANKDFEHRMNAYNSRPHYPLSGTLEGKERYELGKDFELIDGEVTRQYYPNGDYTGVKTISQVAIPIAQRPPKNNSEDVYRSIVAKYKKYISNIEWHIKTNKPKEYELFSCEKQINYYKEILSDLEKITPGTK